MFRVLILMMVIAFSPAVFAEHYDSQDLQCEFGKNHSNACDVIARDCKPHQGKLASHCAQSYMVIACDGEVVFNGDATHVHSGNNHTLQSADQKYVLQWPAGDSPDQTDSEELPPEEEHEEEDDGDHPHLVDHYDSLVSQLTISGAKTVGVCKRTFGGH